MTFNKTVWAFACAQRSQGYKTALVTAKMDVLTDVVLAHQLDQTFDIILNTADFRDLRKDKFWERAFATLGDNISYINSLLIEDRPEMPALLRAHGGIAYEFTDDAQFGKWLRQVRWQY